jgi:hypothetical protein
MDNLTRDQLDNIRSPDPQIQNQAFSDLLQKTAAPVDWAYEAWDELIAGLSSKDNHVRAISAQILANLACSDPENRMAQDFESLLAVTRDERFVTARHCLQSIWKVGLAGPPQRELTVAGLERRFHECATEKNCTLIRYDIIQDLRNLYDQIQDDGIRQKALELIETESDLNYRKKYAGVWKTKRPAARH